MTAKTDRNRETFSLLPSVVEGTELVGSRNLIGDAENFVVALRKRNSVTAQYTDLEGVVKEIRFSLSGSSAAINKQFDACALEFTNIDSILAEEATQELP